MTDGVRRLSHEEAEMLISARMDELLDRADSRALLVHLQTCESCRAFAVQSEVLGRELAALPVLPASAIVDRQIRETISRGNSRWSLARFFPQTGGNSGLRAAVGAVAVLTLVSVFLLIRMAGNDSGSGTTIEAPNGGLAQQLDTTSTAELAMAGPTDTPRVVAPPTTQAGLTKTLEPTEAAAPTQAGVAPTEATEPTRISVAPTESSNGGDVPPTATLDSAFVYTIDKTKTPKAVAAGKTPTAQAANPTATENLGNVAIAAVGGEEGTPDDLGDGSGETEVPAPTETPSGPVEDETDVPGPTETPSVPPADDTEVEPTVAAEEPTEEPATATPPEPTLAPTMTPTAIEISVDATEETEEPATEPPANDSTAEATEDLSTEVTETPETPTSVMIEVSPTEGEETPTPTEMPEVPFTQPTIAPISGASANTGDEISSASSEGSDDQQEGGSPAIVASDGSDVEAAGDDSTGGGNSPPIVSINGSAGSETEDSGAQAEATTDTGVGGETDPPEPTEIPTVDASVEPSGLDLSDTVAELPSGTTSPVGRLEFSPGMNLYVVTAPDGQLAVADLDGELVVTLGAGELPVWSGGGLMFAAPGDAGTVVGIWDSDSGDLSYIPSSADEASSDLPIGGDGGAFYFLRTFPDRPGAMEIRSASIDGSDNGSIWSSDSTTLAGARPVWTSSGILLPTDSGWLSIGTDGSESELGENPYGAIGAPVVSPGEGLITYSAGDQVVVAWSDDPGTAVATAPFNGGGGYAFSTSGEEIVISDGSSLHAVSYEGDDLGTLGGNQPIGGVYWISDTIYYIQVGEDAALQSTNLNAIESDES